MADDERPPGVDDYTPAEAVVASLTTEPAHSEPKLEVKREREADQPQDEVAKRPRTDAPAWNQYLQDLLEEQTKLQPFAISLPHCARLLQLEIDKLRGDGIVPASHAASDANQTAAPTAAASKPPAEAPRPASSAPPPGTGDFGTGPREPKPPPLYVGGPDGPLDCMVASEQEVPGGLLKSIMKVVVPSEKYPGYNFVGRLLGPRGNTLKELQKESGCKMLIRGKGSVKFKDGESEHQQQEIHPHLREPLHVLVDYEGYAVKRDPAFYRALELLAPLLAPPRSDADDLIKQEQLRQLALLNGSHGSQYREREEADPYQQGYYGGGYEQGYGYGGYEQQGYHHHHQPHENQQQQQQRHQQGGYGHPGGYGGGYGGGYRYGY